MVDNILLLKKSIKGKAGEERDESGDLGSCSLVRRNAIFRGV